MGFFQNNSLQKKNTIIDFFVKQQISPVTIYAYNNSYKKGISDSSKSFNKNKQSSKNNALTDERKSVTILRGSVSNGTNEKD